LKKLGKINWCHATVRSVIEENSARIDEIIKILGKRGSFTPPTSQEVEDYARFYATQKKGVNGNIDGEKFCDSYEKKGWMIGKSKMKNWKAAVRMCVRDGWTQKIPSDRARDAKKLRDKAYADAQDKRMRLDYTDWIMDKTRTKSQLEAKIKAYPPLGMLVLELRPDIYRSAK